MVTFASGYPAEVVGRHEILEGADDYLPKPFSPATLARKVRDFLNARRERLGQIPEQADNPPDDTAAPAPADTQRERAAGIRRCDDGRCSVPGG